MAEIIKRWTEKMFSLDPDNSDTFDFGKNNKLKTIWTNSVYSIWIHVELHAKVDMKLGK